MSVEIPKRGTRGIKFAMPPGPLRPIALWLFERVMRLKRTPLCELTTVGAKSGKQRTVPLRVFDDGPRRWLVIASLGGAAGNPAWLHNLAAHPDQVWLTVKGQRHQVTPSTLTGADRAATWERVVREAPQFGEYQRSTDREIPIVRLTA